MITELADADLTASGQAPRNQLRERNKNTGPTLVRLGSAADPLGSARTSGGPLADPPGVLFAWT